MWEGFGRRSGLSRKSKLMQVFLCGSGAASHQIAHALRGFLGDVIQDFERFRSSAAVVERDREVGRDRRSRGGFE
jgi:hypothetical protein